MFSYKKTAWQDIALAMGCRFMLDNGCFSGKFEFIQWLRNIEAACEFYDQCIGVILPDAVILDSKGNFVKGDWLGTLHQFYAYIHILEEYGMPAAYALQDDHPIEKVPFDDIQCLFIAGSTVYKESAQAKEIGLEAKRRGIHVHVGRVSSIRRMEICDYADTFDGTTFRWQPAVKHARFDPYLEDRMARGCYSSVAPIYKSGRLPLDGQGITV